MNKKRLLACAFAAMLTLGSVPVYAEGETEHTVTFVYNMANFAPETVEVEDGSRLGGCVTSAWQQATQYTQGYSFDQWYSDEELTQPYDKKQEIVDDVTLYAGWHAWDEEETELYNSWNEAYDSMRDAFHARYAYTNDSIQPMIDEWFVKWNTIGDASTEVVEHMNEQLSSLEEVKPVEDVLWYIWGDDMPSEDTSGNNYFMVQDGENFRPSITACMVDDQSKVKGNIVVCSGGGYSQRSDHLEAWPTAAHMSALGYNVFVVNYRIKPNETIDASLDLQRAIRYIKYHAEEKGIGAIDNIATIGFSAGGLTISNQLLECYGDITPDAFYPDYVCDDVDKVNADYKVAAPVYGFYSDTLEGYKNEHIPAFFCAVGSEDGLYPSYVEGYDNVVSQMGVETELHVYEGAPHGFGMGDEFTEASAIDKDFDAFLMKEFGIEDTEENTDATAEETVSTETEAAEAETTETEAQTSEENETESSIDENSFEVEWEDAVLLTTIKGVVTLEGDDGWRLNYESSYGPYELAGFYYEEDGTWKTEVTEDGGLGAWLDGAWEGIGPAVEKGLNEFLGK